MTAGETVDLIVKILVGVGGLGGLVAFFNVRAQQRKILSETGKTVAEADSIVADAQAKRTERELNILAAYERNVGRMQEQLDDANGKIDELSSHIDQLTEYIDTLITLLRAHPNTKIPPMPRWHRRSRPNERTG